MELKLIFLLFGQVPAVFSNLLNTSYFEFFYGRDFYDIKADYPLYAASKLLLDPHFNNQLPTMMFLDGFRNKINDRGRRVIVDAFLSRGDYSVINVNWDKIAGGNYVFNAFPNSIKYGDVLAEAILKMTSDGFNFDRLHIVGHSLGSQLASFVGRAIVKKSGGKRKLRRITGLDPAGPLFYPGLLAGHISEGDAELVDVMHTDGQIYSTIQKTGTVDFWPNGARHQPGCPPRDLIFSIEDLCGHMRALEFFAESVAKRNAKTFIAMKCRSWDDFTKGKCNGDYIYMGMDTSINATGDYFLQTNEISPFSRGMEGLKFAGTRETQTLRTGMMRSLFKMMRNTVNDLMEIF